MYVHLYKYLAMQLVCLKLCCTLGQYAKNVLMYQGNKIKYFMHYCKACLKFLRAQAAYPKNLPTFKTFACVLGQSLKCFNIPGQ